MDEDDPATERLFPIAHPDDAEAEAGYQDLVAEDLRRERLTAIQVFEETLAAARLDEEQVTAWLHVLNDLRLVIGTRLDITEDFEMASVGEDDEAYPHYALYGFLTYLLGQTVDALAEELPG